jgi:tRNA-Thr(GGU) m(6)t(6)A37 methyltransferase TsaA
MARPIPPKHYADDAAFPERLELRPIGVVRSPHKERHGTPRQAVLPADPALRPSEGSVLELFPAVLGEAAVRDLDGFEMLWVIAWMHLNHGWGDTVVPPGEDPRRPKGLLSTRAPHRPNPIALSAVRLCRVEGLRLHVERCDLLDGTPILDVKPYVPYADAFPGVRAGWLDARAVPRG